MNFSSLNNSQKQNIIAAVVITVVIVVYYIFSKVKPVPGATVSSGFGYRTHPINGTTHFHNGLDLSAPAGTPIRSIAAGKVEAAGYDNVNGNYVKIKHDKGGSFYGHMLQTPSVKKGQRVFKGTKIGLVGSTGLSTGPHVHFILYDDNWQPIDPQANKNIVKV